MPYATNGAVGTISQPGWIEITPEQYTQAIEGMTHGKVVTIEGGFAVIDVPVPAVPEPPAPTLDEARTSQKRIVTAAANDAMNAGFTYNGHTYDSDLVSRTNIIGTATAVNAGVALPEGFTWRTQDNQNVPMTGPDVVALGAAMLAFVQAQYVKSWTLKGQIDAAENVSDVQEIQW